MDEFLERIIDGRLRTATAVGIPAFDFAELTIGAATAAVAGDSSSDPEADADTEADAVDIAASARGLDTGLVRYVSIFAGRRDSSGLWGTLKEAAACSSALSEARSDSGANERPASADAAWNSATTASDASARINGVHV